MIKTIATAMNKFEASTGDLRKIQREGALLLVPRFRTRRRQEN